MSEPARPSTGSYIGWLYLGTAVFCILLGLFLMTRDALDAAVTILLVGVGSALLALSAEQRMAEAGRAKLLRNLGGGVVLVAALLELLNIFFG